MACPNRRVQGPIKEGLKDELKTMEDKDIIAKADEPTEWISNIIIVGKSCGTLKGSLDPCYLKKYFCTEQYPIHSLENIASKIGVKKVFSIIGMKEGVCHNELDDKSSKLCIFTTPF